MVSSGWITVPVRRFVDVSGMYCMWLDGGSSNRFRVILSALDDCIRIAWWHGVKVRFFLHLVSSSHAKSLDTCAYHDGRDIRTALQEQLMVIRAAIGSNILTEETVEIKLSLKRTVLALGKESEA